MPRLAGKGHSELVIGKESNKVCIHTDMKTNTKYILNT